MVKKNPQVRVDKKVLTFFLIAFPTILIISIGLYYERIWWIQILLAVYQFILLKQFLDNYYEVLS